jgi:predicted site-specific integrase-resolvase
MAGDEEREQRGSDELLTTAQAAKLYGINRTTLGRYARDGLLRPTVVLPSGHLRWSLDDLRRQMRELRQQGQGDS